MEPAVERSQRIHAVKQSLMKVLRFLSNYLPLANAHSTDFITHDLWNSFLPDNIRDELKRLDDSELIELLSDFAVPDKVDEGNHRKDSAKDFCGDGNSEVRHRPIIDESGDECEKWEKTCPYFSTASLLGNSSQRKLHSIKDCPPCWVHTSVSDFIKDAAANSLENLGVLSPLESIFLQKQHSPSQAQEQAYTIAQPSGPESTCRTNYQHHNKLPSSTESVANGLADIDASKEKDQAAGSPKEVSSQSFRPPSQEQTSAEVAAVGKDETPFVAYYMSEKKSHEVEILSAVCAHLVKEHSLDLAVDLGSGKGYLGIQLSRQFGIAVVGIDSSPGNTAGAERRRQVVDKQWSSLVQSAHQAASTGHKVKKGKNWKSKQAKRDVNQKNENQQSSGGGGDCDRSKSGGEEVSSLCPICGQRGNAGENSLCSPDVDSQGDAVTDTELEKTGVLEEVSHTKEDVNSGEKQGKTVCTQSRTNCCDGMTHSLQVERENTTGDNQVAEGAVLDHNSNKGICSKSKINQSNGAFCQCMAMSKNQSQGKEETSTKMHTEVPNKNADDKENSITTTVQNSLVDVQSKSKFSNCSIYVPLTQYVDSAVSLTEEVKLALASHLGQVPNTTGRMLLTGLHTCGGLGASLPRLFLRSPEVQVLAYVGCCYNLLQESFAADPFSDTGLEKAGDFPLSAFLTSMGVGLGRTARNLASQSPHRILANREVPGRAFYKRALLEVILQEVTGGTQEWHGLRGVEARSKSIHQYVCRAFQKLGLTRHLEQLTESLVTGYDRRYGDQADKLAAFCQLKAALGPSLEAVLVLDRYLFLLEQPEVLDVKLVKLFDPVKSPRCYALVAVKR